PSPALSHSYTRPPPPSTLFPTRRSSDLDFDSFTSGDDHLYKTQERVDILERLRADFASFFVTFTTNRPDDGPYVTITFNDTPILDRKSTRLNSSHEWISYAVFCLKKKKT